jgi:hypothetical protein
VSISVDKSQFGLEIRTETRRDLGGPPEGNVAELEGDVGLVLPELDVVVETDGRGGTCA